MSILIKGVEMPGSCAECPLLSDCSDCEGYHNWCMPLGVDNGYTDYPKNDLTPSNKRRDDCPLVPVPPHGRLGDLDELESGLRNMAKYQSGYRQQGILGCCETIRLSTTIIPAEEADNGT